MLQKVVFQDDLFYITRTLDTINDALRLDITKEIFTEKIAEDLLFFDSALQKLFHQIEPQSHLPDYLDIINCLYFCMEKYVETLRNFLNYQFKDEVSTIAEEQGRLMLKKHEAYMEKIHTNIEESDIHTEPYNVVSQKELSQLLNF